MPNKKNQYKLTFYTEKGTRWEIAGHCDKKCQKEFVATTDAMDERIKKAGGLPIWLKLQKKKTAAGTSNSG